MSKYDDRDKIILSENGNFSVSKLVEYFQTVLGLRLSPVQGQYNTFWLTGRLVDGSTSGMIDGPKYYKLVFDEYGVEVKCSGMFNAFSMRSNIIQWVKEEVSTRIKHPVTL